LSGLPVSLQPAVLLGSWVISHGHEIPAELPDTSQTWIVGHQHPAVTLATKVQSAKMACYAVCAGTRSRPRMVLLPAFSRGPLGSNLLTVRNWLLPVPRPAGAHVRIYGLIEPADLGETQVLDFGDLAGLG
jgi:metallophosphoesterase superfamily enzyme